jgi:hypothetical protein
VKKVKQKIKAAIEQQTQTKITFHKESVPKNLKNFHFGSYAEIHFLRLYAARISGYSLDEAYEIDAFTLGRPHKMEEEESGGDSYSVEDEFKEIWGISINKAFKERKGKAVPFRFKNLVCFPDNEGIYIPYDFSTPIEYKNLNIGSNKRLLLELEELQNCLEKDLLETMNKKAMKFERYLLYVRDLWWRIYSPCKESASKGFSFNFG